MTPPATLSALRAAMADFPPLEAHTAARPIELSEIYYPRAHAAALDPERSLVIGNRGMGKSFWANALVNPSTRSQIAIQFPESRLGLGPIDIEYGFAEGEGNVGVSRDELKVAADAGASVEAIWRAVTLPSIARLSRKHVPDSLSDRLKWIETNPGDVRDVLRGADHALTAKSGRLVFVFDQLEQLSDDVERRSSLIQGVLRLALAYKSYRNIRLKIFMRPDQRADARLFQFPDASKISGEAVELDWRPEDLYGLLYTRLRQAAPGEFTTLVDEIWQSDVSPAVPAAEIEKLKALRQSAVVQRHVFDRLAGPYMGTNRRRGLTYSWLVLHLADSRNQVSPRTFLRAIKFAAERQPAPTDTAIDYRGIYHGVNKAAENRVDDLKEDYPWVPPALEQLKGLLVPCDPEEMMARWRDPSVLQRLRNATPPSKMPGWLSEADDDMNAAPGHLLAAMATIGVVERRETTGKVDVPDIFRLPDDIRRKGGVTPQQRRTARLG